MEKRRRTTLPEDLTKQYRKAEERKNKFKMVVEQMSQNSIIEYKRKSNIDLNKRKSDSFKDKLAKYKGEKIQINHEKALQKLNSEKEKRKYEKIDEYIRGNNIDPKTVHTEENDEKFIIRYINEFGEIINKEFTIQELLDDGKQKEDK